jgi:hypothetical protein
VTGLVKGERSPSRRSGGGRVDAAVGACRTDLRIMWRPEAHAGSHYALTGPQALTFGEVADTISAETGRPISYQDIDPEAWISGAIAIGVVPAGYAVMLRWLTSSVISGNGSTPSDDIEKVTGHSPTPFPDFVRRNLHAWTSPVVG